MAGETEKPKSPYAIDRENGWNKISDDELKKVEAYSKGYIDFLSKAKTERLFHDMALAAAKEKGFTDLKECADGKGDLKAGSRVFMSKSGKTMLLAIIGKNPLDEGMNIVGGHIDSPRLDIKPNPLYEEAELAMFDTHYYGGIKKYQWVTIPLAIHGVIIKQDGTKISVSIGDDPSDPVFVITDLLPHLGKDQAEKKMSEAITGEGLNLLIGSKPVNDKDTKLKLKLKVKENILKILNEKYSIVEEDLCSADIEIVPAGPARELGFDRSMILGYGQDDRICSYAALQSILDISGTPEYTTVVLLCDKEEIGSYGATGMESFFFENTIADIIAKTDAQYSDIKLRRALDRSRMISADVNSLHDPNYPEVSAPNNNMPALNYGIVVQKYTGSRGKSGASEATPEFFADIRRIFNSNNILWQTGELGKVDMGGGGTIAFLMARYGMDVVDCGPGLLSMHSPWEVSSKLDAFMAWKAYKAFLLDNRKK